MQEKLLKQAYDFAQDFHKSDTSGHDFEHIKRVYANACLLLKETPEVNIFILKMSVLLHDIDDRKLNGDGQNTLRFLKSLSLEQSTIDTILSTIEAISFSKGLANPQLETIEMKLLYDADKLDALGAIGICRTIMFGTSSQKPLFKENIFPQENLSKEDYKNMERKENHSINHFFDKLLKLKDTMQTETGKKEGLKRHNYMVGFLQQFFQEQNLNEWQKYLDNYLEQKKRDVAISLKFNNLT